MHTPTPSFSTLSLTSLLPPYISPAHVICSSEATVTVKLTESDFIFRTGCRAILSMWTNPSQDKPDSVSENQSVTISPALGRNHFAVGRDNSLDLVLWGLWWYISPICVDLAKQEMNSPYVLLSFAWVWICITSALVQCVLAELSEAVPGFLLNTSLVPVQTTVIISRSMHCQHIDQPYRSIL